jgi:hypothetical protein
MARARHVTVEIDDTGIKRKALRQIEKIIAEEREKEMRKRCIKAAHYVRDELADSAPKAVYKRILMGEPLERFYNKNTGYDIRMDSGAQFRFVLQLSTERFSGLQFKGWNPIWGLIVSSYGRAGISYTRNGKGGIPIAVQSSRNSRKIYNHPRFGTGYRGRYRGMSVAFVDRVAPVTGNNWIDQAVNSASAGAYAILAGKEYKPRKQLSKYWG